MGSHLTSVRAVYRVGGGSRLSGLMLAAATGVIMFIGPSVIAYLRAFVICGKGQDSYLLVNSCHGCRSLDLCSWYRFGKGGMSPIIHKRHELINIA